MTGVVLPGAKAAKAAKAVAFAFNNGCDMVEACASSSGWLACRDVWHPALAHFCGLAQLYWDCLEKQTLSCFSVDRDRVHNRVFKILVTSCHRMALERCHSSPETSMSISRLSPPLLPLGFKKSSTMMYNVYRKKYVKHVKTRMGKFQCRFHVALAVLTLSSCQCDPF